MIRDSVPRPASRKRGNVILTALHSRCGASVSGLEREHKLTWVTQVFSHQLDLTRALWGQLELCPNSLFQSSCSRGGNWPSVEEAAVIGQLTH